MAEAPAVPAGMAQVAQAELDMLRGARALLGKLIDDPSDGLSLKRKIKAIVPDAKFPELDLIDTVTKPRDEAIAKLTERLDKMAEQTEKEKKEAADKVWEQNVQSRLDAARKQYGFTDEGIDLVLKRMKEQQSADVEGAAAYIYGIQPKPAPTNASGMFPSKMDLFGSATKSDDPKIQLLHNDPLDFLEKEAIAVLNEMANEAA